MKATIAKTEAAVSAPGHYPGSADEGHCLHHGTAGRGPENARTAGLSAQND